MTWSIKYATVFSAEAISLANIMMNTYSMLPISIQSEKTQSFPADYAVLSRENIVPHKPKDSDFALINVNSTYIFTFTVNS